jgi:hypothetical protein
MVSPSDSYCTNLNRSFFLQYQNHSEWLLTIIAAALTSAPFRPYCAMTPFFHWRDSVYSHSGLQAEVPISPKQLHATRHAVHAPTVPITMAALGRALRRCLASSLQKAQQLGRVHRAGAGPTACMKVQHRASRWLIQHALAAQGIQMAHPTRTGT